MNRELIVKSKECKQCTAIVKNLKYVIPAQPFQHYISCVQPNQEIHFDFGGPIFDEKKGNEIYFLAAIDRFYKYPTACIYEKVYSPNVLKFLYRYIKNHVIPRSFCWEKAKSIVGNQAKTFCNRDNNENFEALVNGHRDNGLVEKLIQRNKNKLACIKKENLSNNSFNIENAKKVIIHQFRICKQKTSKFSPFEAHLVESLITH